MLRDLIGEELCDAGKQAAHAALLAAYRPQGLAEGNPLAIWLQRSAGIVAAVAVALSLQAVFPVRGLVQRVGEAALFANLMLLAWQ